MSEPEWLSPDVIVELNEIIVGSTGEPFQLRDPGLLEGALARPYSHWTYGGEADVVALAITLLFAITSNHPFAQGNKRTAFEAAILFLDLNGYIWSAPDNEIFAGEMIRVIQGEIGAGDFYAIFEPWVLSTDDLEDLEDLG